MDTTQISEAYKERGVFFFFGGGTRAGLFDGESADIEMERSALMVKEASSHERDLRDLSWVEGFFVLLWPTTEGGNEPVERDFNLDELVEFGKVRFLERRESEVVLVDDCGLVWRTEGSIADAEGEGSEPVLVLLERVELEDEGRVTMTLIFHVGQRERMTIDLARKARPA